MSRRMTEEEYDAEFNTYVKEYVEKGASERDAKVMATIDIEPRAYDYVIEEYNLTEKELDAIIKLHLKMK